MLVRRDLRGSALAMVFLAIMVAVLLAFVVAEGAVFELQVASQAVTRMQALNNAESAVSIGIAAIMAADDVQQPLSPTLTVSGSGYYLTFNAAASRGLPVSINNLLGTTPALGVLPGEVVPAGAAELLGTGASGDIQVQVEAFIHFPPYPYVVASSGTFKSPCGGVLIAQASCPSVLSSGVTSCNQLLPGSLVSNSHANPAVLLGPHSKITGCICSVGGITIMPPSCVKGAANEDANPVPLPSVAITDPTKGFGGVAILSSCGSKGACPCCKLGSPTGCAKFACCCCCPPPPACATVLSGLVRAPQSVCLTRDLYLRGAVLYVCGNLTVAGKLMGTGALVLHGALTVNGGAQMSAQNLIAVLAGGNVTLAGGAGACSVFNGLIYTQGTMQADNLKLYGNFVANGACACPCSPSFKCAGNIVMNNATVVGTCQVACLTLESQYLTGTCTPSCASQIWKVNPVTGTTTTFNIQVVPSNKCPPPPAPYCPTVASEYQLPMCACPPVPHKVGCASFCPPCPLPRPLPCPAPTPPRCRAVCWVMSQPGTCWICPKYYHMDIQALKERSKCQRVSFGKLFRPKKVVTTNVVFSFNFNQFVPLADHVRLMLWRKL